MEINVVLDPELDSFVSDQIASGGFANVNEVIAEALRILRRDREEDDAEMARLCAAIDEGLESGVAEGDVIEQVLQSVGLPARPAP